VEARTAGATVEDLHDLVLARVLRELGRMWSMVEIPIADEHYGTRIVERAMDLLVRTATPAPANGRRVLTLSVGGNQHDLGIRMVAERFELRGWQALQLGADMPGSDLEWTLSDRAVDLVAMSATLVLHLGSLESTIAQLRHGLGDRCPPILVGGAPFVVVPDLWAVVGADGCAPDAGAAVEVGERLVRGR
jgi:methanogenic corrinoid protein MtbC1